MTKLYHVESINFAGNAGDLVHQLHKSSRAKCVDDKAWMKETAHRFELIDGTRIRVDTSEHFVDDLMSSGRITALTEN